MSRPPKIFLDRRATTNGKKSHLNWDNSVRLGLLPPGGEQGQVLTKLTDEDYDVYWEDVANLINITINPILIGNVRFVMVNGDDSTALPNTLHQPWNTVLGAVNGSNGSGTVSAPELVYVYPGWYSFTADNVDSLVRNNSYLYLSEGAILDITLPSGQSQLFAGSGRIGGQGLIQVTSPNGVVPNVLPVRSSITVDFLGLFHTELLMTPSFNETHVIDIANLRLNNSYLHFGKELSISSTTNNAEYHYHYKFRKIEKFVATVNNQYPNHVFKFSSFNVPPRPETPSDIPGNKFLSLDIDYIWTSHKDAFYGAFFFDEGSSFDNININVDTLISIPNSTGSSPITSSILTFNNSSVNLNFKVKHARIAHCILTRHANGVSGTSGIIDVTCDVINREGAEYPLWHGLIDMRGLADRLLYKIDVTNYYTKWPTLLNVGGSPFSTVTGRINDRGNEPYDEPIVSFGWFTNISGSTVFGVSLPCLMSDLYIRSDAVNPCFGISNPLATGADIPAYNVRSNGAIYNAFPAVYPIQPIFTNINFA